MISKNKNRSILTILSLIIGGEAIFFLPFVMPRIFRPSMLEYFAISNTELGSFFSIYGLVAMISYLFGGLLADRYPARNLMVIALILSSLGGMVLVFIPSAQYLSWLYAWWAIMSIFLFWAAMIRATREWGSDNFQGRAFGWLEGGRGATAALLGTLTYLIFSMNFEEGGTLNQNKNPFHLVILATTLITGFSALLIWFFVPLSKKIKKETDWKKKLVDIKILLKNPSIWMLSIIIVCAYVGYKITDDFSLYAREVLGFSEPASAGVGTAALWLRAIVAVVAGFMGDKHPKVLLIILGFLLTSASALLLSLGLLPQISWLLILNLTFTAVGIYSVRSLYFAILKEAEIDWLLTGTAVGLISFIGFTPDVFMSPWMGYLLDRYPGEQGHHHVFAVLSAFAFVGAIFGFLFYSREKGRLPFIK